MSDRESRADSRFACDDVQRACFEAGIKMATIYHQFTGAPFCGASRASLEKAIAECIRTQPYVEDADVEISADGGDKSDQYSYTSLTGNMIEARVAIRIGGARVVAEMRYDAELDYPLMYVSSIERLRCSQTAVPRVMLYIAKARCRSGRNSWSTTSRSVSQDFREQGKHTRSAVS